MVKKSQESSTAISRQAQVRLVVNFYLVFFALGFMLFTPILIYHWWGNSPAFVSEMYVKNKSWKYDINIEEEEEYEDCDMDDNCTTETRWVTVVSKSNQGDYRQEPSWPDIRSVQSGEREVRQENYYIDFFDPQKSKEYRMTTGNYSEYKSYPLESFWSVTVNNFGAAAKAEPVNNP